MRWTPEGWSDQVYALGMCVCTTFGRPAVGHFVVLHNSPFRVPGCDRGSLMIRHIGKGTKRHEETISYGGGSNFMKKVPRRLRYPTASESYRRKARACVCPKLIGMDCLWGELGVSWGFVRLLGERVAERD
ncbi:uncharacterized protein CIMG_13357 [Coccidioides immitis RS]|uniref:uncharacterized protein n=1 Tax=Coccidioides immitis (strain RS) TaxID=246410 RepID=UPI00027D1E74|nr:uncharacterized protein CIMG_13357 [Coccidioides immitis RS]EAS33382.3 hypothetical protein CIMG_13357 [Coccidioides immitis RS]